MLKNSLFEFNKENLHILYLIKKIGLKIKTFQNISYQFMSKKQGLYYSWNCWQYFLRVYVYMQICLLNENFFLVNFSDMNVFFYCVVDTFKFYIAFVIEVSIIKVFSWKFLSENQIFKTNKTILIICFRKKKIIKKLISKKNVTKNEWFC